MKAWHDSPCDSQLLSRWDDYYIVIRSDPMTKVTCGVGSAHNRATYLTDNLSAYIMGRSWLPLERTILRCSMSLPKDAIQLFWRFSSGGAQRRTSLAVWQSTTMLCRPSMTSWQPQSHCCSRHFQLQISLCLITTQPWSRYSQTSKPMVSRPNPPVLTWNTSMTLFKCCELDPFWFRFKDSIPRTQGPHF